MTNPILAAEPGACVDEITGIPTSKEGRFAQHVSEDWISRRLAMMAE